MTPVPAAVAAAKSLQTCPTLCNPIDGSPPGFAVPGILQEATLSGPWAKKRRRSEKGMAGPWTRRIYFHLLALQSRLRVKGREGRDWRIVCAPESGTFCFLAGV
ncbi:hypothetical protein CapIbe_011858 [Capra ibex]